jgi:DNA-directed RNA polymerase specialized sigma24 family protein
MEGLSYDEIAAVMDCSLDSVKARLRRARLEIEEKARHFLPGKGV